LCKKVILQSHLGPILDYIERSRILSLNAASNLGEDVYSVTRDTDVSDMTLAYHLEQDPDGLHHLFFRDELHIMTEHNV
jgi:hypothetical protein